MILYNRNNIVIKIENEGIDYPLYDSVMNFFKASQFLMTSDFILPYRFVDVDVVIEVEGEAGVDYTLQVGDLAYNFTESISISIPPQNLVSRIVNIEVLQDGVMVAGVGVAFTYYIVFAYVFIYVMNEMQTTLDQYKYARYSLANTFYSEWLENHFGKMSEFIREEPWSFDEYREDLVQWMDSFMKYPVIRQGYIQLINLLWYKNYNLEKLKAWRISPGYTLLPTIDKWVVDSTM